MNDEKITNPLNSFLLSFRAGTLGGIKAGILEILLIAGFGSSPEHFSGLLFALVSYGVLGGIVGVACNICLSILPIHRERRENRRLFSTFILSVSFALILFLIFVFRAFRDFHAERVKVTEPMGLLTILVVLIAAVLVFFLFRLLFQKILYPILSWFLKPLGYGTVIVVLLAAGIILQKSLTRETEEVHTSFDPSGQAALSGKPSIILIMVDAQRPDFLGCYGKRDVPTPNIDALARDATLFRQTYAQATHTKPSTASLLTSRYPTEHQAIHKTNSLPDNVTTLAEIFSQAGYYCGGIVTNVNLAPIYNFQQGFHEYTYLPPSFFFGANESASRLVIYGVLRVFRMKLVKSKQVYHFYQDGETVTEHFDRFLPRSGGHPKSNENRKFFLFLHYMDPHDPYFEHPYSGKGYARVTMPNPDPKFAQPFQDFYKQEVEYLDSWIGSVVASLKNDGLYDSCLIILTADHGEEFYEHGGWWHGTTLYEEQVRIPLLIKRPAEIGVNAVRESLTRSIDVAPTILSVAGLPIPQEMRGRNLFANDGAAEDAPFVFSEADHEGNVVHMLRIGPWKYIQTNPDNPRGRPPEQLFYLPDDPHEKDNLVDSQPEKTQEMKEILEAEYQKILTAREEGAVQEMDRATQERLRALGYTQ